MLYSKSISVPPNTKETSPILQRIKVSVGYIFRAWINFPPGCAGLVKLRVFLEDSPILPVNSSDFIRGDGYVYEYPVYIEITSEPMILKVQLWSEDDTYTHTIDVQFLILPKSLIMPVGSTEGIMESLKSLVLHPIIINKLKEGAD